MVRHSKTIVLVGGETEEKTAPGHMHRNAENCIMFLLVTSKDLFTLEFVDSQI